MVKSFAAGTFDLGPFGSLIKVLDAGSGIKTFNYGRGLSIAPFKSCYGLCILYREIESKQNARTKGAQWSSQKRLYKNVAIEP